MKELAAVKIVFVLITLMLTGSCRGYEVGREEVLPDSSYPTLQRQLQQLARVTKVPAARLLDSAQLIADLQFLASDAAAGRAPGSPGHDAVVEMISTRFRKAGADSLGKMIQIFPVSNAGSLQGKNIVAHVKGTKFPSEFIVVTAHYDHLGTDAGGVFYGADDNASGAACLLAMASYFQRNPHHYSLIFAALDFEESGLLGAYSLVNRLDSLISLQSIKLNLNMDMVARSDRNEIYACGISHYPDLKYLVDSTQKHTTVKLLMGHDQGPRQHDWTFQSDHYAFHQKKIPFLYIGVEDHPDYHHMTDTFDKIDKGAYIENCNMILHLIKRFK